jgi:hypothetical protein
MNGLNNTLKGAKSYNVCLNKANENNEIGVYKHTHTVTSPTSRLGYAGKRPSKKDMAVIAQRLLDNALNNPDLIKAAINMARFNKGK